MAWTRVEVRDLTDAQWAAFVAAVRATHTSGTWDRMAKMAIDNQNVVNGGSIFLPWNRW